MSEHLQEVMPHKPVRLLHREILQRLGITAEELARAKYLSWATADMAEFHDYLSGEKTLQQLQAEGVDTSCILRAEERLTKTGTKIRRIELYSAMNAVEMLMKLLGRLTEQHKITLEGGINFAECTPQELRRLAHALSEGGRGETKAPVAASKGTDVAGGGADGPTGDQGAEGEASGGGDAGAGGLTGLM